MRLLLWLSAIVVPFHAFTVPTKNHRLLSSRQTQTSSMRWSALHHNDDIDDANDNAINDDNDNHATNTHGHGYEYEYEYPLNHRDASKLELELIKSSALKTAALAAPPAILLLPSVALAEVTKFTLNTGDFDPNSFRPVCPTSDGLYRFLQGTTQSVVGPENFVQYGPLIAGGLLRVRLELCVVESFFNEAVGPFIEKEGLSWILPLHETVETFLAGTIFALASTFILVGSTKIVSVLVTYADVFVGGPCRLLGGFFFDRAKGKPVTLDIGFGPFKTRVVGPGSPKEDAKKREEVNALNEFLDMSGVQPKNYPIVVSSGIVKGVGESSKLAREILEATDLFVGRYLTLIATGYIGFKFLHFKVFPDFPPF